MEFQLASNYLDRDSKNGKVPLLQKMRITKYQNLDKLNCNLDNYTQYGTGVISEEHDNPDCWEEIKHRYNSLYIKYFNNNNNKNNKKVV